MISTYKGLVLPGWYNFDGPVLRGIVHKERITPLFQLLPDGWYLRLGARYPRLAGLVWPEVGLNVYSSRATTRFPWRIRALTRLNRDFRIMIKGMHWEDGATRWEYPLEGFLTYPNLRQTEFKTIFMATAYSRFDGSYIGDPQRALNFQRKGLAPETFQRGLANTVASVAYHPKKQQWVGW